MAAVAAATRGAARVVEAAMAQAVGAEAISVAEGWVAAAPLPAPAVPPSAARQPVMLSQLMEANTQTHTRAP